MRPFGLLMALCFGVNAATPTLVTIHDGERCGYAELSGAVAIPATFRNCGDFSEGKAPAQVDERWGYIDEKGANFIAPQFLAAARFSENLAFVTIDAESKGVIDLTGKILFRADYYEHGSFSEGLAPVHPVSRWICPDDDVEEREKCPDGKGWPRDIMWGYIDVSGTMVIPPRFIGASEFHNGLAYAGGGFIDHHGNAVIPGPFSEATEFVGGVAAVQVDYKGWGYINKSGGWLTQPTFDRAGPIEEGRGLVKLDGKYGYVDTSGALVIAPQFDDALPFSYARAAVRTAGKWGYIDTAGGTAIPFEFSAAQSFHSGLAIVASESGMAVIDKRGVTVKSQPPSLMQTFRRLQGFEVEPNGEGPLTEIVPILSIYKQQLRHLAAESLKEFTDAASVKSAIEAELQKAGIRRSKEEEPRPYGLIDDLEVVQPPQQPNLVAVLFHLQLANAIDTSLSLFRQDRKNWDLVFELDRNDYIKWELDAYHMDPPQFTTTDKNGSFLMLVASDGGRGGNGSYGLWVDLYRVDATFHKQQLLHREFGCKSHQIAIEADGLRLETISMEHDVARAGYRVFPYRFEVRGDDVVRVAPIGFDAHDFVGEWGNLPWAEAAKWSDPAHVGRIREYYNQIRDGDGYFGGEFGANQVCDAQQRIWQVEYNRAGADESIYFQVERKDKWTFIVINIGKEMRDGCKDVEWKPGQGFSTMFAKPLEW